MAGSSQGGLWDPERDPARLADVMRRSGYSADQIRRMIAEVADAEAEEAERLGLPGLRKMRDTVSRQTVERWAKGQSAPKGWWARIVLIVIGRLEQTLESGFGVEAAGVAGRAGWRRDDRFPFVLRWVMPVLFLAALLTLAVILSGASGVTGPDATATAAESARTQSDESGSASVETLFPTGATPEAAPPAPSDDPNGARGNGCDPEPALPWWSGEESPPLPDGPWFGHVLEVDEAAGGGHEMVFDLACFYLEPGAGARIDPGSPALEHETAIALLIPDGATVHWPDGSGTHVETGAEEWLDASAGSSGPFPITCPSGRCSAWALVVDGVVVDLVVVDFVSG